MLRLRRRCAQTARISLHYIKFSKSYLQTKNVRSANSLAYPFAPCLQIFRTFASSYRRFRPSPSRFRFGEAVFTETARKPQEQKTRCRKNFAETGKLRKILWLAQESLQTTRRCGNFLALAASQACLRPSRGDAFRPLGTSRNAKGPGQGPDRPSLRSSRPWSAGKMHRAGQNRHIGQLVQPIPGRCPHPPDRPVPRGQAPGESSLGIPIMPRITKGRFTRSPSISPQRRPMSSQTQATRCSAHR
jgi:hypothetical protein